MILYLLKHKRCKLRQLQLPLMTRQRDGEEGGAEAGLPVEVGVVGTTPEVEEAMVQVAEAEEEATQEKGLPRYFLHLSVHPSLAEDGQLFLRETLPR